MGTKSAAKKAPKAKKTSKKAKSEDKAEAGDMVISYDDFMATQLKVAVVLTCAPVPKTSKLFQLTVDAGEPEPRQIVSGLAGSYQAEDLIGKRVVLVANLKPAKIRGVASQGMLLAVDTPEGLRIVEPPEAAPPGTRIS